LLFSYPLGKLDLMIKAAVIGTGYLGKFHAEKYKVVDGASLVAVVDIHQERAEEVAATLGVKALSDYRDLPALGVQCASVVSDTSTHFQVSKWLLENGIDVLVEKPMTVRIEEAEELIRVAKSNGRVLQVGHLERFNPAFKKIEERLTRPLYFEARRIAVFTGRGSDVDVVRDLMIHDIDIISHLVKRPLKRVEAIGVPVLTASVDIASARLTFEGGCVANVTASRAAFKAERTIRIFQPDLYVSLDYGAKKVKLVSKLKELDERGLPKIEAEEYTVEDGDALRDEISSFVQAVASRGEPIVRGEDGMKALLLVEQISKAVAEGLREYDPGLVSQEILNVADSMAESTSEHR